MSTEAQNMRESYLDFADNMAPPPQSRYARALGAMSADYQGCLADLRSARANLLKCSWAESDSNLRNCLFWIDRALASHLPESISLPLTRAK